MFGLFPDLTMWLYSVGERRTCRCVLVRPSNQQYPNFQKLQERQNNFDYAIVCIQKKPILDTYN